VRLTERSVDLAIALAMSSAAAELSVPGSVVAIGEVGLAGEVRRVPGVARRLAEAGRMGFRRAIVPAGSAGIPGAGETGDGRGTGHATLADVGEGEDVRGEVVAGPGGRRAPGVKRNRQAGPVPGTRRADREGEPPT